MGRSSGPESLQPVARFTSPAAASSEACAAAAAAFATWPPRGRFDAGVGLCVEEDMESGMGLGSAGPSTNHMRFPAPALVSPSDAKGIGLGSVGPSTNHIATGNAPLPSPPRKGEWRLESSFCFFLSP